MKVLVLQGVIHLPITERRVEMEINVNKVRKKLLDFKERLSDRHMYSIVLVVTAIIASMGIYQYKRALDFQTQVVNGYQRSFSDMADYVDSIDNSLTKALLVRTPSELSSISSEIWRKSAFAQANLGQLPITNTELDNTSKFLSQVGDYTYTLSKKVMDGKNLTTEERTQLKTLSGYATNLNKTLQNMESDVYSGTISFNEIEKTSKAHFGSKETSVADGFTTAEQEFADYPSLIYDGPFSNHLENMEAALIKNQPEITVEQAQQKVAEFLSGNNVISVESQGDVNGKIPTYSFQAKTEDKNRQITVDITKQGGIIMLVLDNKSPPDENLQLPEAAEKAKAFLLSQGLNSMKESYYQRDGNSVTFNFAYEQDNVIMYPDLVKVKIALDNGEMIGYEAKGYIINHHMRDIPSIKVTKEQALAKINADMIVERVTLALIPLDTGKEVFCYEIKGKFMEKDFLLYVNTQTGKEENVLIMLETPNGVLTI